jgi:hypothetical protein
VVHIPLSQLRQLPGAPELEDAWLRARAGQDGYLSGTDAETAACDAQTVPVVTGSVNPGVIDQMIALAQAAAEAQSSPGGTTGADGAASADPANDSARPAADAPPPAPGDASADADAPPGEAGSSACPRSGSLSPEAWRALRYAVARLAVDLVSGPAGIAAVLRQGLLDKPCNTPSLPLDIG